MNIKELFASGFTIRFWKAKKPSVPYGAFRGSLRASIPTDEQQRRIVSAEEKRERRKERDRGGVTVYE